MKLVRNKVPDIIRAEGRSPQIMYLPNQAARITFLEMKLLEEVDELVETETEDELLEEMADLLEVLYTLAGEYDISPDDIQSAANEKAKRLGGFEDGVVLI